MTDDEPPDSAFERGKLAGQIDARLAGHDKHFASINGQLEKIGHSMAALVLGMQRLGDAADADRKTVVVTATALENAEKARRDKTEQTWSPWQRTAVLIGACAAALAVYLGIRGI